MRMKRVLWMVVFLGACEQQPGQGSGSPLMEVDAPATPAASEDQKGARIEVWSDANAKYTDQGSGVLDNGNLWLITRRDGPSGVSYAKREIDCGAGEFRYTQEGDTLESMSDVKDAEMAPLTEGSISTLVSDYACRKHERRSVTGL